MGRKELELALEDRCVARIEALGGLAVKLAPRGTRGFPDRTVLLAGRTAFIEFKRPSGGVVAAQQDRWREMLEGAGFRVWVVNTDADFDIVLWELRRWVG